ncbi:MAG: UDP-N-acetylglucosamine 2-epimerase (non-hydrolyzing) [Thermoplasmata archaeon]
MNIVTFAETRPQYIKAATLSRELRELMEETLVIAGPHDDPSKLLADFIEAPKPRYNLGNVTGSSCERIARYMAAIEKILDDTEPDAVLTFGDSDGVLATAIASAKCGYPIVRVDAGLRTHKRSAPEELNRIATDHISNIFFCPTAKCVDNLAREGIVKNVFLAGDLMVDALMMTSKIALQKSAVLQSLGLQEKSYIILAIHNERTVSDAETARRVIVSVISSGERVVFALDPKIEKRLERADLMGMIRSSANVTLTSPMSYTDFTRLAMGSAKMITDSGVIQREAYILKVPCIVLREESEWQETVDDGWTVLVGTDDRKIADAISTFEPRGIQRAMFGEGKAAIKIARVLYEVLNIAAEGTEKRGTISES